MQNWQRHTQRLERFGSLGLRLWVGSMVGGGSAGMVAFSQDKYSGRVIANAGQHRMTDTTMMRFGSGYQNASVTRGCYKRGNRVYNIQSRSRQGCTMGR